MSNTKVNILTDKLSDLLRQSLADLRQIEHDPDYSITAAFHGFYRNAGFKARSEPTVRLDPVAALLVVSLGNAKHGPEDLDSLSSKEEKDRFQALDCLTGGHVKYAGSILGVDFAAAGIEDRPIRPYTGVENSAGYYEDVEALAAQLAEHGF